MQRTELLKPEVQAYILEHLQSNLAELAFKKSPFPDLSMSELLTQIKGRQKLQTKWPSIARTPGILCPPSLNLEQSSSEQTAEFKKGLLADKNLESGLDMTCGFGIDSYYLSQVCNHFESCELNSDLSEITKHNFQAWLKSNVEIINSSSIEHLEESSKVYDLIFVDPSRRNDLKGKVFRLEDCLPNIIEHKDLILRKSRLLMVKNSPFLDITSSLRDLNQPAEVYIIALNNEVKEVLLLIGAAIKKDRINCINIKKDTQEHFSFDSQRSYEANYALPQKYLYEPNAAIMKSGGFTAVSQELGLNKLEVNSHLYTSQDLIDFPGRTFEIQHIVPGTKKELKKIIQDNKANISVRNYPLSVAQIRKKTGLKDGSDQYIFFTTLKDGKLSALICKKR